VFTESVLGHVHVGPGVTGTRLTNPAVDLHDLLDSRVVYLTRGEGYSFSIDENVS
jgi:hypothetical protein